MFEDYLQDSYHFLSKAEQLAHDGKDREAKSFFRASVFYVAGAMEAFVNYLADSFSKAKSIPQHEIFFLTDTTLVFSKNKGFVEKTAFHSIEDKLRLLISKFVPSFNFNGLSWNKFVDFKALRNSLVHPREVDDERGSAEYAEMLRAGLKATIEIMNEIMKGMSGRPLRKQILDLIPD
jgi:hypothetical protein